MAKINAVMIKRDSYLNALAKLAQPVGDVFHDDFVFPVNCLKHKKRQVSIIKQ